MPKRPRDLNQLAKLVVLIGLDGEHQSDKPFSLTREASAGSLGGAARAQALTPDRRSEIASFAAQTRWKKKT